MYDIEYRKIQEAIANLLQVKDEIAQGAYGLFEAYKNAGFTEEQALKLVISHLFPKQNQGES